VTGADTVAQTFQISGTTGLDSLVDKINEVGGESLSASLSEDGNLILSSEGNASVVASVSGAPVVLDDVLGEDVHTAINLEARLAFEAAPGVDDVLIAYGDAGTAVTTGVDQRREAGQLTASIDAVPANVAAGEIIINGFEIPEYDNALDYDNNTAAGEIDDVVAFLNQQSASTGVVASKVALNGGEEIQLQSEDGAPISIAYKQDPPLAAAKALTGLEATNDTEASGANVSGIDISTAAGAQKAISVLDDAIQQVGEIRGDLGAVSNRLDYTTRNLSNISENAASARSQIMDADFAAESANLSRAQVLQQAGNAMLAQANSRPQQVLSLLQ
jgi:flagellin